MNSLTPLLIASIVDLIALIALFIWVWQLDKKISLLQSIAQQRSKAIRAIDPDAGWLGEGKTQKQWEEILEKKAKDMYERPR